MTREFLTPERKRWIAASNDPFGNTQSIPIHDVHSLDQVFSRTWEFDYESQSQSRKVIETEVNYQE